MVGQNVLPRIQEASRQVNAFYYTPECNRTCFHPPYASRPRWNVPSLNNDNVDVLQLPLLPHTTSTTPSATL